MLSLENVNVAYGDVQVLWDVSMSIDQGELVALVGANASGKSTTINTLSGLVKPLSGSITFDGKPIHGMTPHKIVELGIVQVPEGRQLFSHMSVMENLELGAFTAEARKSRKKNIDMVFDILPDLKAKAKTFAVELSGGQQQMCAIARGLMAEPKLLMIDELSLGLSPLLAKQMFDLVKKIHEQGITVLLVEQNVRQSLLIADSASVLENGCISMCGKACDLMQDEGLKKAYLGM